MALYGLQHSGAAARRCTGDTVASPRRLLGRQATEPPAPPATPGSGGAHRHGQRVAAVRDRSRTGQAARSGVGKPECSASRECQRVGHQWREDKDCGPVGDPDDLDPITISNRVCLLT